MANIDINNEQNLNAEDLEQVKGGALLLPAVQKVREAATTTSDTLTAPALGAPVVKR